MNTLPYQHFTAFRHALEQEASYIIEFDRFLDRPHIQNRSTYMPSLEGLGASDNPYFTQVSNEGLIDGIKTFSNKIWEMLKTMWSKFISFCKGFGKMVAGFGNKIMTMIKNTFKKEKVVKDIQQQLLQEAKTLEEGGVKTDEKFKQKAEFFAEMVGKKDYFTDLNEIKDIRKRMNAILNGQVQYERIALDNVTFKLNKDDWKHFAFNGHFRPFDPNLLRAEQSLSATFLAQALRTREIYHPETFEKTLADYAKQFSRVHVDSYNHQMALRYEELLKPIFANGKLDFKGNVSANTRLVFSNSEPKQANPLLALRDKVRNLIPKLEEANQKEFRRYEELYYTEKDYQPYLAAAKELLKDIDRNRKLLETEEGDLITKGFTLNDHGLNKLLEKNEIKKKIGDPKSFGKALVNFMKDNSITAIYFSQFCLSLFSRQCAMLNRQIAAFNRLEPELNI